MNIKRLWTVGLVLVLASCVATQLSANPYAVFIVHCEPKNADDDSFLNLLDMVMKADQKQVKLTIDFTPPWAEMILDNPEFLNSVTQWHQAGHELAVHHHPYWVSETRGTTWDGYTNTPQDEISPKNRSNYRGDIDDYMDLLNQLPGTRTSGTMGISYEQDVLDWPHNLLYSAYGHEFSQIISQPEVVEYAGHHVWQMTHGLFWNAMPVQLENAYREAASSDIFAAVTHVSNYEDSLQNAQAVENYFSFLGSEDPSGNSLVTVTQAMNLLIPNLLLGDTNNDNQVTGADLVIVQQNFGNVDPNTPTDGLFPGDANDDGQVTGGDLIIVQQNFGNTLGPVGTEVPEPVSICLLVLSGFGMLARRCRVMS